MCPHSHYAIDDNGDFHCLDCHEVYLHEDELAPCIACGLPCEFAICLNPDCTLFNPESKTADDIPY